MTHNCTPGLHLREEETLTQKPILKPLSLLNGEWPHTGNHPDTLQWVEDQTAADTWMSWNTTQQVKGMHCGWVHQPGSVSREWVWRSRTQRGSTVWAYWYSVLEIANRKPGKQIRGSKVGYLSGMWPLIGREPPDMGWCSGGCQWPVGGDRIHLRQHQRNRNLWKHCKGAGAGPQRRDCQPGGCFYGGGGGWGGMVTMDPPFSGNSAWL